MSRPSREIAPLGIGNLKLKPTRLPESCILEQAGISHSVAAASSRTTLRFVVASSTIPISGRYPAHRKEMTLPWLGREKCPLLSVSAISFSERLGKMSTSDSGLPEADFTVPLISAAELFTAKYNVAMKVKAKIFISPYRLSKLASYEASSLTLDITGPPHGVGRKDVNRASAAPVHVAVRPRRAKDQAFSQSVA